MEKLLRRLDNFAGINTENAAARLLERIAFVFLILMVVSAPHSIAATQTAWLTGMFAWLVRLFIKPRPHFKFTLLDGALWAFFLWSVITSLTSYAPDISINKLRGTAVFLIFYFVVYNLRNLRSVHFAAFALIASCMVNVVWTPLHRIIGRGVEIHGVATEGPLAKASLRDGDTLVEANRRKLESPEDVIDEIERNEVIKIKFSRPAYEFEVDVKRADLLEGATAMERLGIESWSKNHNWRSSGFYGHYTTYAEVLQLIGLLIVGIVIAGFTGLKTRRFAVLAALFFCLAGVCMAMLLTTTRAPQLAFMIAAFVIVLTAAGRKIAFAMIVIALPLALGGLIFLQQFRQVGFFDSQDESIKWRQTVWSEGYNLWLENPRHFFLGVGMDSINRYAGEWRLFDNGRLNIGHFHSTPLQLLVERGLPALILWMMVLGAWARAIWRGSLREREKGRKGEEENLNFGRLVSPSPLLPISHNWAGRGILLGCLGGIIGFFTSGLVHYNLGDQEIAMVFFLLMGLGVKTTQFLEFPPDERAAAAAEIGYRIAA